MMDTEWNHDLYLREEKARNLDKTVELVVKLLIANKLTLSTAESCTGGMLSQWITSVPGSSDCFEMGICSYANRIKAQFLEVPEAELSQYGAVSSQVAISMARGIQKKAGSDLSAAVTGIAGPGGGTPEKPVGTVWLGFRFGRLEKTKLLRLWELKAPTREHIRKHTALAVFLELESFLQEERLLQESGIVK